MLRSPLSLHIRRCSSTFLVGTGTKTKVLSLVLVPQRCLGQGGPNCPCLRWQPGHHRHVPGSGESLGRGLLAGLQLGILYISCQKEAFMVCPVSLCLDQALQSSQRLVNQLAVGPLGSVLEKYGQSSASESLRSCLQGCHSKHSAGVQ